jgi:tetratricopeptide (TPR) repeat protein
MRRALLLAICATGLCSLSCVRGPSYYLDKGNQLFSAARYEEASLNYKKALQKDTNSAEPHFRLGISELRQDHFPAAWEQLNRAFELAPNRDDIKVELGELCLVGLIANPDRPLNQYNRLKEISAQLLAKDSNSFAGLRFRGYLALIDRKLDDAIESLRRANQLKPAQADVAITLAQALFANSQEQDGERVLKGFIQTQKSNPGAYDALYARYTSRGRIADAEEILKLKISNNPQRPSYVTQLCNFYWRTGKQNEALQLAKTISDGPAAPADKYLALGDFYGSIEHWPDAKQQFEKGLEKSPADQILFQKRIANVFLAQGKRAEALALIDTILKEKPEDREALLIRSGIDVDGQQPQAIASAISRYQSILKKTGDADPTVHYALGRALLAKGDLPGAKAEFKQMLSYQPNGVLPRTALAEVALTERKPQEALDNCNQALTLDPRNETAHLLKAMALKASGNSDQARTELDGIVRDSPRNATALLQLGLLEIERKDFKAAQAVFAKLPSEDVARAAGGLATMYAAEGQTDRAIETLQKAVSQAPKRDQTLIHSLLASLAARQHNYGLAIEQYQTILSEQPNSVPVNLQLAEAYRLNGNANHAISILEQVQNSAPREVAPALALASTLEAAGSFDRAIEQYRHVLQLKPDEPSALNNLAYLLVETGGNLEDATRFAQRAVQIVPDQANFTDTLGWIYVKRNMNASAVQLFDKLVTKYPDDPTFQYHFGAALLQNGEKARARSALQMALDKGASPQDADKIHALLARTGA